MTKINQEEYEILKGLDDKWKWIARNEDKVLYVHTEKPVRKDGCPSYWDTETESPYSTLELFDGRHLFRFIQWSNSEPYNIAELIEEYESEETETKRDIKWLMQWIEEYESEVIEECKDELKGIVRAHSRGKQSAIKRIKQKIDQLEVLSLLVPEQEEVDRAYKDGYEEGREHGFYKGYREGLANKGGEPETVADVVTTFWKSYERLKEVMNMEVEELEE